MEVSQAILIAYENIRITIFCSKKHLELIRNAEPNFIFSNSHKIRFCSSISNYEINFLNVQIGDLSKYQKWVQVIAQNKTLLKSNLIVSDNHIAPLLAFKNVILMGSFIWNDIIKSKVIDYKIISSNEKRVLKKNKPQILCLENMAMDNLSKYTLPVFCPWFTDKHKSRFSVKENSILVTGGGTSLYDSILIQISNILLNLDSELKIYFDRNLYNKFRIINERVKLFPFEDIDFCKLKAIICRPGIGILTDCIKYNIPIIAISDFSNVEISSNAIKVEKLNLGVSINVNMTNYLFASNKIISLLNNMSALENFRFAIEKQSCNGSKFAATHLLSQCSKL